MSSSSSLLKSSDVPLQTPGSVQSSRAVLAGPASSNKHRQPQASQTSLVSEVQTHALQGGSYVRFPEASNAASTIIECSCTLSVPVGLPRTSRGGGGGCVVQIGRFFNLRQAFGWQRIHQLFCPTSLTAVVVESMLFQPLLEYISMQGLQKLQQTLAEGADLD